MPHEDHELPNRGRTRRHIWVDDDDWQWVCSTFEGKLTPSAAVRTILKKFRKGIEARAEAGARRPPVDAAVHVEE